MKAGEKIFVWKSSVMRDLFRLIQIEGHDAEAEIVPLERGIMGEALVRLEVRTSQNPALIIGMGDIVVVEPDNVFIVGHQNIDES